MSSCRRKSATQAFARGSSGAIATICRSGSDLTPGCVGAADRPIQALLISDEHDPFRRHLGGQGTGLRRQIDGGRKHGRAVDHFDPAERLARIGRRAIDVVRPGLRRSAGRDHRNAAAGREPV